MSSTSKTFETSKLVNFENINAIDFKKHDSVLISASTLYLADDIKIMMQGEQYRAAWSAPVKVPILFLDTLFGGVKILKEGGGKQTHSLKIEAPNGIIYTLRSINKDPKPLIPDFAKTLGLENIVVDGVSAQHPYGAILAAELQEVAQILHTHPQAVFLPKQKKLGQYNDKYGNRLFLLEYEPEGDINWTTLKNIYKLLDTEDLQELKKKHPQKVHINERALVRARLFDLVIGDWDRHTKQWGWAVQKKDSNYVAFPIAADRDNAFFHTDGIIPSIISNENVVPELRSFTKDIDFMEGLVYPFDRYFLIHTPESVFVEEAKSLQHVLFDEVIDETLYVWPENIIDLDGKTITDKIKSRRDDLVEYAQTFKKIIDKKGVLEEALKGSKGLELNDGLSKCFECD
ncbi:hypothetical protein [Changchengzhania lutea]|uniref:hypothetical protein n=1 Tax=Changchengzhania lutea TaxID=2049305 RepID=UPI001FE729C0|nr:hypothetical protein [Changchengzhania lutea]